MYYNNEIFKNRLIKARKEKNLTQKNLAEALFISRGAVAHWEIGSRDPNLDMVNKLAKELSCTPAYLLGFTSHKQLILDDQSIHFNNYFYSSDLPMYIVGYYQENEPMFIDVNKSELDKLGYTKEEFLDLNPKLLCKDIYGEVIPNLFKNVSFEGVIYITKEGDDLPVNPTIIKLNDIDKKIYIAIH